MEKCLKDQSSQTVKIFLSDCLVFAHVCHRGCVRGGATRAMAPGVFGSLLNKIGLLGKFPKIVLVVAPGVLKS